MNDYLPAIEEFNDFVGILKVKPSMKPLHQLSHVLFLLTIYHI